MLAIILTLGFAIIEAVGGFWAHSLTLLGDSGHMASDAAALAIAAFAAWIALRPPSKKHSYGLGRAEVIAAWVSSLMLLIISLVIIIEAVQRINSPVEVGSATVMVVGALGILINALIGWMLMKGERTINIRAALLHVASDLLGSLAALAAGIVIYFTDWYPIDPILSIFIGILIMISSVRLLRESMSILMEGVPHHLNIHHVSKMMTTQEGVTAVHDLHIWTLSSGKFALSAHVDIQNITGWDNVLLTLKSTLKAQYHIEHVTLQPEPIGAECQPCLIPEKKKS